jgi:hypothetical protein
MSVPTLENTVIYLIGFPGVGKYTIAKEIAKRANFVIVDNQMINNPIFSVVGADGKAPLPRKVWDAIATIRNAVFDTIEHLSPRHFNFILTNAVMNTDEDRVVYSSILDRFERRQSRVFSVCLRCSLDEHKKRIVSESRKERFKEIDPEGPVKYSTEGLIDLVGPNVIDIDVTAITAAQAADIILEKVNALTGVEK